jgi:hypothetical protein
LSVRTALAGLLLLAPAAAAVACGYCVEDRIAAAYDHSIVVRALDRRHEVAFFAIEGSVAASPGVRREIQSALESTGGIDRGTGRVSRDGSSLSFAYDSARQKLGPIMRALEKRLAPQGLNISLLRVIS